MGRKKKQASETAPEIPQVSTENQESSEPRYVVVREGHRVSDVEYETANDPKAIAELEFWRNVSNKHSWGEPCAIVQYDNKIHRVWDEK